MVVLRSPRPLCAKCCPYTSLKYAELNLNLASSALSAGRGEGGRTAHLINIQPCLLEHFSVDVKLFGVFFFLSSLFL